MVSLFSSAICAQTFNMLAYKTSIRVGFVQSVEPLFAAVATLAVDVGLALAVTVAFSVQCSRLLNIFFYFGDVIMI